jgi:hypothetical protein
MQDWGAAMSFWQTIVSEMSKGNFSFFILIFGVLAFLVCSAQLIVMIMNYLMIKHSKPEDKDD